VITRVIVNRQRVKHNATHGTTLPVFTIREGAKTEYAHAVELLGPARLVYRPDKPLSCGARVWLETTYSVRYDPVPLEEE